MKNHSPNPDLSSVWFETVCELIDLSVCELLDLIVCRIDEYRFYRLERWV